MTPAVPGLGIPVLDASLLSPWLSHPHCHFQVLQAGMPGCGGLPAPGAVPLPDQVCSHLLVRHICGHPVRHQLPPEHELTDPLSASHWLRGRFSGWAHLFRVPAAPRFAHHHLTPSGHRVARKGRCKPYRWAGGRGQDHPGMPGSAHPGPQWFNQTTDGRDQPGSSSELSGPSCPLPTPAWPQRQGTQGQLTPQAPGWGLHQFRPSEGVQPWMSQQMVTEAAQHLVTRSTVSHLCFSR